MSSQVFALPGSLRIKNINHFCKEDVVRIFGYLGSSEIARTVFPVCKKWNEIGRDPMLWKKLSINIMNCGLNSRIKRQIIQVVQNATLLEVLVYTSRDDVSRILQSVGQYCPRLKVMYLFCCSAEDELCVQTLVFGCPLIEEIAMLYTSGSALNQLAELKRLKKFSSSENRWFNDLFFNRLSMNNRHLECLLLGDLTSDHRLVPLFANLKSVLKEVRVDCSLCSSRTYEMILQCRELRQLEIVDAVQLKDSHLKKLETLPLLEHVLIENAPKTSSKALCSFIKNVKSSTLESVSFLTCPNVDLRLEQFLRSHVDTVLYKVKRIDLGSCKNVTDRLVDMIIKGNPVLEHLSLSSIASLRGTAFNTTDISIAPHLKDLIVTNCRQIVISYLHSFRKNRPNLKIVFPCGSESSDFSFVDKSMWT